MINISCLFGLHRPSLQSITRRQSSLAGICEGCARPLEKGAGGRWTAAEPVYSGRSSNPAPPSCATLQD
jgi:hypothetical protein